MTEEDEKVQEKGPASSDAGIEYRATIRFPQRDYEFMQRLIQDGEYTNITEIVRDAVKRFRHDWTDMEAASRFGPMGPMMGMRMMPRMRMMRSMWEDDRDERARGGE